MKTDLEIAEEALAKWPTTTMGILRTGIRDDLLLPAIADARAAGYAEAKERAANAVNADLSLFDEGMDGIETIRDFVHVYKRRVALIIAGLAPAATTEGPKRPSITTGGGTRNCIPARVGTCQRCQRMFPVTELHFFAAARMLCDACFALDRADGKPE